METAPLYLAKGDSALRREFFKVVSTIPSSGDHARVLTTAIDLAEGKPAVTADILRSVEGIASSGDKTRVLVSVMQRELITTQALRDRYIEAARTINSSSDYRRAIEALMAR